jgi:hypothetical protein
MRTPLPKLNVHSDTCWVCEKLLLDSGGDPSRIRNTHHVIPQAYGGKDGPIVSLDSAHHDLLHLVADKILAKRPFEDLLLGLTAIEKERILYLATRVVVAAKFSDKDPNKRLSVIFSINAEQGVRLKELTKFHGVSRQELFTRMFEREYNSCFPKKSVRKS